MASNDVCMRVLSSVSFVAAALRTAFFHFEKMFSIGFRKEPQELELVKDHLKSSSARNGILLDDIIGLDDVKQVLREALILPSLSPQIFEKCSLRRPWKLILLYGPPGTGKSSLVEALANETRSELLRVTCADLLSSWFGESEKIIRNLFDYSRSTEIPSILFIDEIDSICRSRSSKEDETTRRIKTELLLQFDRVLGDIFEKRDTVEDLRKRSAEAWVDNGDSIKNQSEISVEQYSSISSNQSLTGNFHKQILLNNRDELLNMGRSSNCSGKSRHKSNRLLVICATNCYADLDAAFLRRFQQSLYVEMPNFDNRVRFFETRLRSNCETQHIVDALEAGGKARRDQFGDIRQLGAMTDGFSCSDLDNVLTEVSYRPVKELWSQRHWKQIDGYYYACDEAESNRTAAMNELPSDKIFPRRIEFADFRLVIERLRKQRDSSAIFAREN
ncbi:MAG: hypothetical protein MHMPM18_000443 [Marteilia pararefringens]